MKPRSVAILLAFCTFGMLTSYAQSEDRIQRLKAVAKQLQLTRHQEEQLMPILKAEEPKLEAIQNDSSLSPVQKLQQLRALHDQTNPQVKAILTPEQYQQLQEIRRKRRAEIMQAAKSRANQ
jgi:Spy/CpxP family protein refolding chaperone